MASFCLVTQRPYPGGSQPLYTISDAQLRLKSESYPPSQYIPGTALIVSLIELKCILINV